MKIKQSFIDRTNDIKIGELMAIATICQCSIKDVINALLLPSIYYSNIIYHATAVVLKISLSDIYEVEDLPHTL